MFASPVPYDSSWPSRFRDLRADLADACGHSPDLIDHIGSTAVEGLLAKPVIDIQIGVAALDAFPLDAVRAAGFEPDAGVTCDRPFPRSGADPRNWEKRYARLERGRQRLAHLHIREIGRANHRFALLFRDFLRSDADTRALYAEFKATAARVSEELAQRGGTVPYNALKSPVVALVAHRAEDWAARTGWTLSE